MLEGVERASERYAKSILLYIITHEELETCRDEFIDGLTANFYAALYATCIKCEEKGIASVDDSVYEETLREEMSTYPTMDEYAAYLLKRRKES